MPAEPTASHAMDTSDFDDKTAAFLHWFEALPGATFSPAIQIADLRSRGAGRGMVVTQDIPADTILFTIPRSAILNTQTSGLAELLPGLFESHGDEDDQQALDSWSSLILVLMYEFLLGERSTWKPYMDILPDRFDTPMFWSEEELSRLQGSATLNKIGRERAEEVFRGRLVPAIRGNGRVFRASEGYSDEELVGLAHRMGSTIMAYAFDLGSEELEEGDDDDDDDDDDDESDGWVEDREGKSMMGMVAMADVLNADAEFNAHVHHGEVELTVTTLRDIKAGEEILNYYGPHPNSELLRRYGYVTEKHSRYDVVEIPWPVVQDSLVSELGVSEEVVGKAMETFDQDDLEDTFVLERNTGEPNPDGTLPSAAAVEDMPEDLKEQLKRFLKTLQKMDGGTLIPDKRKRDDLLQAVVVGALRAVASRYATTAGEDEELLRREDLARRHRMAITARLGEKRLIEEAFACLAAKAAGGEAGADVPATKRVRRDAIDHLPSRPYHGA